jgi:hypothetical protein
LINDVDDDVDDDDDGLPLIRAPTASMNAAKPRVRVRRLIVD